MRHNGKVPARVVVLALAGSVWAFPLHSQIEQTPEKAPLQIGFEQRVRNEDWNNLFDMSGRVDDEREQIRYRTRLWADVPLPWSVDFHVGIAQETNQKLGHDNCFDEVFFETAYVDVR